MCIKYTSSDMIFAHSIRMAKPGASKFGLFSFTDLSDLSSYRLSGLYISHVIIQSDFIINGGGERKKYHKANCHIAI